MIQFHREKVWYLCSTVNHVKYPSHAIFPPLKTIPSYALSYLVPLANCSLFAHLFSDLSNNKLKNFNLFTRTCFNPTAKIPPNIFHCSKYSKFSLYSSYSNIPQRTVSTRAYPRNKKHKNSKDVDGTHLTAAQIELIISQLPPRFNSEDLCKTLSLQRDPRACLELFNYASQQPRFRHDTASYHITIKKLGSAKLYEEMDGVVNQVLAVPAIGSEALFNTIIYFYTEARRLSKAVHVYKHMKKANDPSYRPSVRTYNLLFTAFLSRRSNSYINHMYMETIRCLFKQMVNDGIEPDIFSLNSMIKGYVLSLHVNDALRIFHQMGVTYQCQPDSNSYDYLIHGLCCQGRTKNAKELYKEMKDKGFVPSAKAYNSLTNSLAIGGELKEAVRMLWEMNEKRRTAEFITYRTVLDEICRQGKVGDAMRLLKEFQEKDLVDGHTYRKLLHVLEDEIGDSND
ncbi:Pentatricopeptide repeat [Macleaya cordata]|uniref:Pentatricopeptide repeat n=1 Tax=Macleaya cordata TaxID=56857 RepID=A0A200R5Y0_MACCD|nr:Pentatricopeptide repeat [Macleaya cordata]